VLDEKEKLLLQFFEKDKTEEYLEVFTNTHTYTLTFYFMGFFKDFFFQEISLLCIFPVLSE
jgi:hypothetical protein